MGSGARHDSFRVPTPPRSGSDTESKAETVLEVRLRDGVWRMATGLTFEEQRAIEKARGFRSWPSLCLREELVSLGDLPGGCATDLVPDEHRGWDSDDLTAQVHLGASDIPDVLGGCHDGRPCRREHKAKHVFLNSL